MDLMKLDEINRDIIEYNDTTAYNICTTINYANDGIDYYDIEPIGGIPMIRPYWPPKMFSCEVEVKNPASRCIVTISVSVTDENAIEYISKSVSIAKLISDLHNTQLIISQLLEARCQSIITKYKRSCREWQIYLEKWDERSNLSIYKTKMDALNAMYDYIGSLPDLMREYLDKFDCDVVETINAYENKLADLRLNILSAVKSNSDTISVAMNLDDEHFYYLSRLGMEITFGCE